jgi:hypothetical protein
MTVAADETLNLLKPGNDTFFDSGAFTLFLGLCVDFEFIPQVIQIEVRHNAPHP